VSVAIFPPNEIWFEWYAAVGGFISGEWAVVLGLGVRALQRIQISVGIDFVCACKDA